MKSFLCLIAISVAAAARAESVPLRLDPARTTIEFTVPSVLHTVHGHFALKEGMLQFDPATAKITGRIVVDPASGESGNDSRDHRMHKSILETDRYPEIVFTPDHFTGELHMQGDSQLTVHGSLRIHGADHPLDLPVHVRLEQQQLTAEMEFSIPYVKWGMKNPSTLFLRVNDTVAIQIHAVG